MPVPFSYIRRNLWVRKLTTALTAGGMALVVFVFAAVLMLDAGLKATLVGTGSPDNVVLIRQGSQTEVQSGVFRDQAALIETAPEIARGPDGQPLVSKEVVVLNSLPKISDVNKRSNVVVRGLPEIGRTLRPQVRIVDGRMFRAGSSEIVVGTSVARGFAGVEIGQQLSFAGQTMDRRGNLRRRQERVRFRDLGRCRADDAGVSTRHVFVGDRQTVLALVAAGAEGSARRGSAIEGRRQARSTVLRRPVGQFVDVHHAARHDALCDFFDRRNDRCRDHDVLGGRDANRGNRDAARVGLSAGYRSCSPS